MPPFLGQRAEAGAQHQLAQQRAVGANRRGELPVVGPGLGAEEIEGRSHRQFAAVSQVDEGEIDSAAARVARFLGDVAVAEQVFLVHPRVVIGLGSRVAEVGRPAHEMVDGALRTVTVEHLQAESERCQRGRCLAQRGGRRRAEYDASDAVAIDRRTDEIVLASVTCVGRDLGSGFVEIDETFRQRPGVDRCATAQQDEQQGLDDRPPQHDQATKSKHGVLLRRARRLDAPVA